jgi:hypothetical protein
LGFLARAQGVVDVADRGDVGAYGGARGGFSSALPRAIYLRLVLSEVHVSAPSSKIDGFEACGEFRLEVFIFLKKW